MCKKVVSKGLCKESIYEMLLVHSVWYDLIRYDAICQFQVPLSVTIESPGQVRSNFEYDYPDRVQAYHDRGFRFGRTIKYARAETLQHVHNDQLRSVNIGCDLGLTTVTIMVEGDHN